MNNFANFNNKVFVPSLLKNIFAYLFTPRPTSESTYPLPKVG